MLDQEIIDGIDGRVRAGARFLDGGMPGWENGINLGKLDVNNCLYCVLGQIYGNYSMGARLINADPRNNYMLVRLGFTWTRAARVSPGDPEQEMKRLTASWRRLILARRAERVNEPAQVEAEELVCF